MIENEDQYNTTWDKMNLLSIALADIDPGDVYHPLYEASLRGQIACLQRELEDYQNKKKGSDDHQSEDV